MSKPSTTTLPSRVALALFTLVATVLLTATTAATTSDSEMHGTQADKVAIKQWLAKQPELNKYGDAEDTIYAGGSPLFDESTAGALHSLLVHCFL
jgi:Na+-translocating ferredoxin:NAD+ oxidoreductase RnfG subunit